MKGPKYTEKWLVEKVGQAGVGGLSSGEGAKHNPFSAISPDKSLSTGRPTDWKIGEAKHDPFSCFTC